MNSRLTVSDLSALLSQATGKDIDQTGNFLQEFLSIVDEGLFADKVVKVNSIGTFKIIQVEKRESIDVNTKERILIPEHFKLSFTPDKEMRTVVNKPFEVFETIPIEEGTNIESLRTIQVQEREDYDEADDTDEIIKQESSTEVETSILEIAQEANAGDRPTVIIKEDILPTLPEEKVEAKPEEVIPPVPDEWFTRPVAETAILPEEAMLPLPEPEPPVVELPPPPLTEEPPLPAAPPLPAFSELEDDEPQELSYHYDDYSSYTNDYYIDPDNRKNIEQNNLKEEYMDNFNVNRRKPGPVPYGQQGSGGSLTNNVAAVILAAVIVVLVIVLAFMLLKPTKSKSIKGEIDRAELLLPQQSIKSEIDNNVDFGIDDSYNEPEIESKPQPEKPSPKKSYVGAKRPLPAISKQLPTSVTTVKGDRLNLLALKYYGDKVYWVYIYAANHTKLQNPDILPLNITLTIPLAQEHGIDLSRLSLRKAYALQRDILNNKSSFGSSSHNVPAQRSYQYNESYDDPYNDGNNYSDDYYDNDEGSIGGDYSGDGSGSDETTDDFGTNGDDLGSDDDFFGAKATGKNSRSTVKRSSGKTNTTNQSKPVSNRRLDVL